MMDSATRITLVITLPSPSSSPASGTLSWLTSSRLAVILAAVAIIVSVAALIVSIQQGGKQRKVNVLQPRLPAYDSALAIAGQLDRIAQIRFIAKIASDEVEESHALTGSTKPNYFAEAYEDYSEELAQQVKRLEELRGQFYFPDDFKRAIGSLIKAALVRNDVDAQVVNRQQNEIRENFQRLQSIHSEATKS
jgi:hypothetical protein